MAAVSFPSEPGQNHGVQGIQRREAGVKASVVLTALALGSLTSGCAVIDRLTPRGVETAAAVDFPGQIEPLHAAANADEALQLSDAYDGPIHLLLTDVVMPGVNGRALAEQVCLRRPDVRVLYMSGYTDDAIVRHGVLEDAKHFVGKPYTPTDLRRKVREVLDA